MNGVLFVTLALALSLGAPDRPPAPPEQQTPAPKNGTPGQPAPKKTSPAQPPAKNGSPGQPPKKDGTPATGGKVIMVELIGAPGDKVKGLCTKATDPTTILFDSNNPKLVFHCVNGTLHDHANHGNPAQAGDMAKSVVNASSGDTVVWFSKTHTFRVVSVLRDKQGPTNEKAPEPPFTWSPGPAPRVTSAPVPKLSEKGTVRQRYKVTFNVVGVGDVDPDLICSM